MESKDGVARAQMGPEDCGGEWVQMGNMEFKVAPLNFDALEKFADTIESFGQMAANAASGRLPGKAVIAGIAEVVHSAISRNHPDVTLAEVKRRLDLQNFADVAIRTLKIGGVKRKEGEPGKEVAPSTGAS